MTLPRAMLGLLAAAAATPAFGHTGGAAHAHGFAVGFAHPFSGLDHVLAMTAVGLWAALVGGRALWAWPLAFVSVTALGAVLGLHGVGLPWVETAIALSVVALGLALALRPPLAVAAGAAICGLFALVHGFAYGAELPAGADVLATLIGFGIATALLHAMGVGFGIAVSAGGPPWLPRAAGAAVAATGLAILLG